MDEFDKFVSYPDIIQKHPAIHEIGKLVIERVDELIYIRLSKSNEVIYVSDSEDAMWGFLEGCRVLFVSYTGHDIDIAWQSTVDQYNHTYIVDEVDD